jgi:hypothetical protein
VAEQITDLQDMLRVAWNLMTAEQQANFAMSDTPLNVIQQGFPHWSEDALPSPGR